MPNQRITDTWLRKNNGKQHDKEVIISDGEALAARLRNGRITFIFRPTLKTGQRIKMTLGRYPEMGLKNAREKAREVRQVIAQGIDPRKQIIDRIVTNTRERTLNDIFTYWYKNYAMAERTRLDYMKSSYNRYIGDYFGKYYYKDLTRQMMIEHFMLKKKKAPVMLIRVVGEFRQAIEYCINHDYLQHANILSGVTRKTLGIKKGMTNRILSDGEIKHLFALLDEQQVNERNRLIIEILLNTGARSGELRQTKLSWLNLEKGIWTIPWQYHKTGAVNKKPLIRPIIDELKPAFERLIEISSNGDDLLTNFVSKSGESDGEGMREGAMLHVAVSLLRTAHNLAQKTGEPTLAHFSNHDLRRTARTNWSAFGPWAVCEKMLGHALPGESDVYDLNTYIDQMIPIYKKWFYKLQEIKGGAAVGSKVVPIR